MVQSLVSQVCMSMGPLRKTMNPKLLLLCVCVYSSFAIHFELRLKSVYQNYLQSTVRPVLPATYVQYNVSNRAATEPLSNYIQLLLQAFRTLLFEHFVL